MFNFPRTREEYTVWALEMSTTFMSEWAAYFDQQNNMDLRNACKLDLQDWIYYTGENFPDLLVLTSENTALNFPPLFIEIAGVPIGSARTGDMHKYTLSIWLRKQTRWHQDA